MLERVKRILSRPKVLLRVWSRLGTRGTLRLMFIKFRGKPDVLYSIRVPQYPYPFEIRGGTSSDSFIVYEQLVQDEYTMVGDLKDVTFVIDGGANIGLASIYFLNRYPAARVLAVEPHPGNLEVCRKNLAPYGERAVIVQGAIWKSAGTLVLEPQGEEWSTRVRSDTAGQPGSVEAFTVHSLMTYAAGEIGILKLDVEGSEVEIFGPSAQEWLPSVRNIVIELHNERCSNQFFNALADYDYDVIRVDKKLPIVACLNIHARSAVKGA